MRNTRYFTLAMMFGAFSAIVATLVSILALAIMGTGISTGTVLTALFDGLGVFIVGVLTVLFVWPRIGFDPFDSHDREHG